MSEDKELKVLIAEANEARIVLYKMIEEKITINDLTTEELEDNLKLILAFLNNYYKHAKDEIFTINYLEKVKEKIINKIKIKGN